MRNHDAAREAELSEDYETELVRRYNALKREVQETYEEYRAVVAKRAAKATRRRDAIEAAWKAWARGDISHWQFQQLMVFHREPTL